MGVLEDAAAPPHADSFIELILAAGISVFGDMVVVSDAAGFIDSTEQLGVFGDAAWAPWAAHGYYASTIYPNCLTVTAEGDDATGVAYVGDDASDAALVGDDATAAVPEDC